VTLHLYDTATREVRQFVPYEPTRVSMYLCGATVQGSPHVGHVRSSVVFDVLRRWLTRSSYTVTLCRNVTDIDDKILQRAILENRPWWAVAAHYEREFTAAYEALGCLPPTVEPRATGHITQMITMIERLISAGHAYESNGSVYFEVATFARYGQLSGQRLTDLQSGESVDEDEKRDPRDFALWKAAKPSEPHWPTPWGPGRPGWHIECSAMATTYLGPEFDIHGGGLDLVFPHHENEVAQAQGAGHGFARFWLHNSWVTAAGEKMSKSLGNSMVVSEVLQRVRPIDLRWYLVSAHYRSTLEFSDAALAESAAGFGRVENFLDRATQRHPGIDAAPQVPDEFAAALNDDLNTPAALAVLHSYVTAGNQALAERDELGVQESAAAIRAMLDVLGADPLSPAWQQDSTDSVAATLDALVDGVLRTREQARQSRDFATADAMRDVLTESGVLVEDTAEGPRWQVGPRRMSNDGG
jgi:cysteinyl-tRNA synthetase